MIKTTYTCDKCKGEQPPTNLYRLSLVIGRVSDKYTLPPNDGKISMDLCEDCCGVLGITSGYFPKRPEAVVPAPTIEDLLHDMISDMVDDAVAR